MTAACATTAPSKRATEPPLPPAPPIALDPFQQLMLHWRSCEPYNAVHIVILRGPANIEGITRAITQTIRSSGIGAVAFDYSHLSCRYTAGHAVTVQAQTLKDLDDESIAEVMSDQLNMPFPDDLHAPVRWLILSASDGASHAVVVTYDHVVADAFAIQALIAEVLFRSAGSAADRSPSLRVIAPQPTRTSRGSLHLFRSLMALTRQYVKLRRAYRMPVHHSDRDGMGIRIADRSVPIPARFRDSARVRGVGLNACIMGALLKSIAQTTPRRSRHRRRTGLAVSTIVSTRDQPCDEPVSFSACLDGRTVFVPAPDSDLIDIIHQIAQAIATGQHAAAGLRSYPTRDTSYSAGQALTIRHLWPLMRINNEPASYRKLFPLCAGVSPFRVNERWYANLATTPTAPGPVAHSAADGLDSASVDRPLVKGGADRAIDGGIDQACAPGKAERQSPVLRILRACPTGPALPLVLAATIRGSSIELVLTYRHAHFDETSAADLFVRTIDHLESALHRLTE